MATREEGPPLPPGEVRISGPTGGTCASRDRALDDFVTADTAKAEAIQVLAVMLHKGDWGPVRFEAEATGQISGSWPTLRLWGPVSLLSLLSAP